MIFFLIYIIFDLFFMIFDIKWEFLYKEIFKIRSIVLDVIVVGVFF